LIGMHCIIIAGILLVITYMAMGVLVALMRCGISTDVRLDIQKTLELVNMRQTQVVVASSNKKVII